MDGVGMTIHDRNWEGGGRMLLWEEYKTLGPVLAPERVLLGCTYANYIFSSIKVHEMIKTF